MTTGNDYRRSRMVYPLQRICGKKIRNSRRDLQVVPGGEIALIQGVRYTVGNMTPVFKILDQIELEKGLVFTGSPLPRVQDHGILCGTPMEIRSGGHVLFTGKVAEFELMRNCWSPHRPRPMAVLVKANRIELNGGEEVWVDETGLFPPTVS